MGAVPNALISNSSPLQLGGVTLSAMEIPQTLLLGVFHSLSVHDFPGGIVTTQRHGFFSKDITWSGILFGADARAREEVLKQLCATCDVIELTYDQFSYQVQVKEFDPDISNQFMINYRITCVVLENNTAGAIAPAIPPSNTTQLNQGLQQFGQTVNNPSSGYQFAPPIVQQGNGVLNLINSALNTAGGDPANISTADAQAITQSIAAFDTALTPLTNSTDPQIAVSAHQVKFSLRFLGHKTVGAVKILTIVTLNNPNLVTLASTYYGDPSLWIYIAQANNLLDYQLTGTYTLNIPVAPAVVQPRISSYLNKAYAK